VYNVKDKLTRPIPGHGRNHKAKAKDKNFIIKAKAEYNDVKRMKEDSGSKKVDQF